MTGDEMKNEAGTDTPGMVRLTDLLGPLPPADGTAETNKVPHPEGGYEFEEVDAWSEPLVRTYAAEQVAAERERWKQAADAAIEALEWHASNYCENSIPQETVDALAMLRKALGPNDRS